MRAPIFLRRAVPVHEAFVLVGDFAQRELRGRMISGN